MGGSFGPPRGRFQSRGFGFRGGSDNVGRGWSGGRQSLFRGSATNSFGSTSGFGNSRGMKPFASNQGPRQPGFGSNGRGFGSWGGGRARSSFGRGNWSGNMGSGNAGGMFGGTFGSMSSSGGGSFGSEQSAASKYESADVNAQFGSTDGSEYGQGFYSAYYDDASGQYGQ